MLRFEIEKQFAMMFNMFNVCHPDLPLPIHAIRWPIRRWCKKKSVSFCSYQQILVLKSIKDSKHKFPDFIRLQIVGSIDSWLWIKSFFLCDLMQACTRPQSKIVYIVCLVYWNRGKKAPRKFDLHFENHSFCVWRV